MTCIVFFYITSFNHLLHINNYITFFSFSETLSIFIILYNGVYVFHGIKSFNGDIYYERLVVKLLFSSSFIINGDFNLLCLNDVRSVEHGLVVAV